MVLGGALVAVQSRVNGALSAHLGSGLRAGTGAAVISFGSGLLLLSAAIALSPAGRAGLRRLRAAVADGRLPARFLFGGAMGAFFVASQGIAVGVIGVALFIVVFTAAQSVSSLVVDHVGLGPGGAQPVSAPRLIAASFATAGVVLKVLDGIGGDVSITALTGCCVLAAIAGALQAVQQAINGRVSVHAGTLGTTWNNFAVGTVALVVVFGASFALPGTLGDPPTAPWYYLGGVLGIGFIAIAAATVHRHGVLLLGLSMIAGQVVMAEILDALDPQVGVTPLGVAGGVLTVAGVVAALALRRATTA